MSSILVLCGSPAARSRTAALGHYIGELLAGQGHVISELRVRDLPPGPLLSADVTQPDIAGAVGAVLATDGLVVASPVYKAAYSGILKTLLDLLPRYALTGKVLLPVVTGGTPAHLLAVDHALRPVLTSLGAGHVVPGGFVLDAHIDIVGGRAILAPDAVGPLTRVVNAFSGALTSRGPLVSVASYA